MIPKIDIPCKRFPGWRILEGESGFYCASPEMRTRSEYINPQAAQRAIEHGEIVSHAEYERISRDVRLLRNREYVVPVGQAVCRCKYCGASIIWTRIRGLRTPLPLSVETVRRDGGRLVAKSHLDVCPNLPKRTKAKRRS